MQRRGASRQPAKGQRANRPKGGPKAARKASPAHSSIEHPQEQLVERLRRERDEAIDLQAASAEVLKIIGSSPRDMKPVFEAMLVNALRICDAKFGHILLYDGERFHATHLYDVPPSYRTFWDQHGPIRPSPKTGLGRLARTKRVAHIPDLKADLSYTEREPLRVATVDKAGARSFLAVPMLKENKLVGAIVIYRTEVRPFSDKQIELVKNFAAQAVIAMENARLVAETREALEQQTATAEVLRVINSSPGNLAPVFETILEKAHGLCAVTYGSLQLYDGNEFRAVAVHGLSVAFAERLRQGYVPGPNHQSRRLMEDERFAQTPDMGEIDDPISRAAFEHSGIRTALFIPLRKEGRLIGQIVAARQEVRPFNQKEIALLENFAAQAVIAMENARLFNETKESLQQQTATADVLKVISRSAFDIHAVLRTLVESAARLCQAETVQIFLRDGELYRSVADNGFSPEYRRYAEENPIAPGRGTLVARTALELATVHIPDVLLDPEYTWHEGRKLGGFRAMLGVPLLRERSCIGVMAMTRMIARPFTDRQIELVRVFADQAVIAIENVRLFDEVKARTEDLRESLQQQTATADVLKVISRSTFDLPAVLQTLVESAARLCDAEKTNITREKNGAFYRAEAYGFSPDFQEYVKDIPIEAERGSASGRALLEGRVVHIPDVKADPEYTLTKGQKLGGYRTVLAIPMLREGVPIGVMNLTRSEVRPFSDKQIELATTFADQAVIAIKNVLLFDEVQARTRELSQSVEELRALGEVSQAVNSTVDLETVLNTIVAKAAQLSGTEAGTIYVFDDTAQEFLLRATYGMDGAIIAEIRDRHIHIGETAVGQAVEQRIPIQIPDIQDDPNSAVLDIIVRAGFRALLVVPLLSTDRPVGALVVRRKRPGEFPKHTVDLLQTFAAQSVLAIQNARLFESVELRTRELTKSLEELRTAQDRLVQTQKLASLGQLTAGIAHEIKNPLNFINNFSLLSQELIDELGDALNPVPLEDRKREELGELTQMLKDNLEKVVQHGKRADSIVKNMLLHSREGSGEHRPVEINVIVDESLNLAYHGARAEKAGFNITMQRNFDPAVGIADVYPQEITRVLLNLISNGFYATTKRKAEAGDGFEPTLTATTKNLGDKIEICIRDNGTGIPAEAKEKIFNPFFTTKPAGEGTGLGLSMSHDIIVKQHGGTIDVDTAPGIFTEFKIVLPRAGASLTNSGERA